MTEPGVRAKGGIWGWWNNWRSTRLRSRASSEEHGVGEGVDEAVTSEMQRPRERSMNEVNSDDDERIQCLKIVLQQCIGTDEKLTKDLAKILESNEVGEKDETLKWDGLAEEKQTSIVIDEMLQQVTSTDHEIEKLPGYLKDAGAPENVIKLVSVILGGNTSNLMLQLVKIWLNPNERKIQWEEKLKELWPKKHVELTINWLVEFITSCTAEMIEKLQTVLTENAEVKNDSICSEPLERTNLKPELATIIGVVDKYTENSNVPTSTGNVTQHINVTAGILAGPGVNLLMKGSNIDVSYHNKGKRAQNMGHPQLGYEKDDGRVIPEKAFNTNSSCEENIVWVIPGKLSFDRTQRVRDGTNVFKGTLHDIDKRKIALKVITNLDKDNKREVQNLKAATRHENVIKYFDADFFDYDGQKAIYIAMEVCDSKTLYDKLLPDSDESIGYAKRRLDMEGIAKGLKYIHSLGIVHRDFKPPNILYKDGIAVVTDFGLSVKLPDNKSNVKASRSNAGTNGWRAPETSGDNPITSPRSDVYSAGLVFYFVLTGKHPYGEISEHRQYYINKNKTKYFSLKALKGKPNAEIAEDLIGLMLQHERTARPTMEEVLSHPFFFDDEKKLEFFSDVFKYLELTRANEEKKKHSQEGETSKKDWLPLLQCSTAQHLDNCTGKYGEQLKTEPNAAEDSDKCTGKNGEQLKTEPNAAQDSEKCTGKNGEPLKTEPKQWTDRLIFSEKELQVLKSRQNTDAVNCETMKNLAKDIKTNSVTKFIRFIRHRYTHNHEDQAKRGLVMPVEELWNFFNRRYPHLFLYVYYRMKDIFQNKKPGNENYSDTMARYFMTQTELQKHLSEMEESFNCD